MKKTAEITISVDVEFEDNGEDDLNDQAYEALKDQLFGTPFVDDLTFDIHRVR